MMIQDEADEMLSRGFKDQIYDVYRYLPPELQVTIGTYSLGTNDKFFPFFSVQFFILSKKLLFFSIYKTLSNLPQVQCTIFTMSYDMHVSNFL